MIFLEDNERFRGDGSLNSAGESLDEFLENYDPKRFDAPFNTVDMIVVKLSKDRQKKQVLIIKRSNHPSIGMYALPGGFVDVKENLEDAAARELLEETGVENAPLIQLRTWGDYDRDPRWRVITTAFLAVIDEDIYVAAGDDAADAIWMDISLEKTDSEDLEIEQNNSASLNSNAGLWKLTLSNEEKELALSACVLIEETGNELLSGEKYKLIETKGIAGDHGCVMTQAFLYLKSIGLI